MTPTAAPPATSAAGRLGTMAALAIALATLAVGIHWNTSAVGGSDSHCYAGQARMFAGGALTLGPPLAMPVPWPGAAATFAPSGFAPGPGASGASVPLCPPGLSLLMAAALGIGGERAIFLVVPLLGALAVWCAFLLGRGLGSPAAGVASAALLACSPTFLYQLVQPMSDVPAAALWMASLALALRSQGHPRAARRALGAGLLAGAAIMVRPNLAPLAAIPILLALPSRAAALAALGGLVPGVAVVAGLQAAMYGAPGRTGYGDPAALFALSHVVPNLVRYPAWVATAHTPVVAAGLLAPFLPRIRSQAWLLLAFTALVFAAYLPYVVFDDWWYSRFLLPGLAVLITLTAVVIDAAARRLPRIARTAALLAAVLLLGGLWVSRAHGLAVFRLQALERKYVELGRYASTALPPSAVVIAGQATGSVRFYAGRPTLSWDAIDPAWLDRTIDELRRRGLVPYFAIEAWELDPFRSRFQGRSDLAGLDWPARASIGSVISVYAAADRARYLAGEQIPTVRITWGVK
jgi:hypothetical protein